MMLLGVEFVYGAHDCTVVVVAIKIIIALLALGFRLATARTIPYEDIKLPNVSRVENSTLYETTYQRAVQILTQYPVVDGEVFIKIILLTFVELIIKPNFLCLKVNVKC